MRLLFLSNFFPPVCLGGYEEWCQEVALAFLSKGHEVKVLTSQYRKETIIQSEPDRVVRKFYLEMDFASFRNGVDFFINRKSHEN
jgi:hypothetical protein